MNESPAEVIFDAQQFSIPVEVIQSLFKVTVTYKPYQPDGTTADTLTSDLYIEANMWGEAADKAWQAFCQRQVSWCEILSINLTLLTNQVVK